MTYSQQHSALSSPVVRRHADTPFSVRYNRAMLLAVDLGLRTGMALYGRDGRVVWYRSRNFGTITRLRRGVLGLLDEWPGITHIVLEGGGPIATVWRREGERRSITVIQVSAEDWRQQLLLPRQQRNGADAKRTADALARRIIGWSDAPKPTSLRHDAAEAVAVGLWGVLQTGWLDKVPNGIVD